VPASVSPLATNDGRRLDVRLPERPPPRPSLSAIRGMRSLPCRGRTGSRRRSPGRRRSLLGLRGGPGGGRGGRRWDVRTRSARGLADGHARGSHLRILRLPRRRPPADRGARPAWSRGDATGMPPVRPSPTAPEGGPGRPALSGLRQMAPRRSVLGVRASPARRRSGPRRAWDLPQVPDPRPLDLENMRTLRRAGTDRSRRDRPVLLRPAARALHRLRRQQRSSALQVPPSRLLDVLRDAAGDVFVLRPASAGGVGRRPLCSVPTPTAGAVLGVRLAHVRAEARRHTTLSRLLPAPSRHLWALRTCPGDRPAGPGR
jgi:hypothetical protein